MGWNNASWLKLNGGSPCELYHLYPEMENYILKFVWHEQKNKRKWSTTKLKWKKKSHGNYALFRWIFFSIPFRIPAHELTVDSLTRYIANKTMLMIEQAKVSEWVRVWKKSFRMCAFIFFILISLSNRCQLNNLCTVCCAL